MSISDNAILFKIVPSRRKRSQLQDKDLSFYIQRADWELFDEKVKRLFNVHLKNKLTSLPADHAAALMFSRTSARESLVSGDIVAEQFHDGTK